jgi:hypothetical protein
MYKYYPYVMSLRGARGTLYFDEIDLPEMMLSGGNEVYIF